MGSEVDDVAMQGIEFWTSIADEEVNLDIELQEVCVCLSM